MRIIRQRWTVAPPVNGCRWCGFPSHINSGVWALNSRPHEFEHPTTEQWMARDRALRNYAGEKGYIHENSSY